MKDLLPPTKYPMYGQLYICNLGDTKGSIQGGRRPVVVVQSNEINKNTKTVVVIPITSMVKKRSFLSHVILRNIEGLMTESMLLIEQIRTVNISDLEQYLGCISDETVWKKINTKIRKTLGIRKIKSIRKQRPKPSGVETCLCHKCVSFYKNSSQYRVKLISSPDVLRDTCDRCGRNLGYDYLITEKRR